MKILKHHPSRTSVGMKLVEKKPSDPMPENNQTCPECGKGFYNALSAAFKDAQIVVACPHCKRAQLIEVRTDTAPWKKRCKAQVVAHNKKGRMIFPKCGRKICDRVIYDLPFSVKETAGVCPACTLIFHLREKYKDLMKASSEKAAAKLGVKMAALDA